MTPTPSTKTTSAYFFQAALAFAVSLGGSLLGIAYLPIDTWQRAFLGMTLLFLVTSAFTLAKVIRDQQEASSVLGRVDEARLEKLIAEHDPFKSAA
ncbi:YiaA/YiaB family inner membrane protein [Rhodococcus sp. NPDC058521]|uniref:YiaA/YiaB family inner membrane protein n=1 Tax=Rhodococcus sp. NPDC058521 TaxID=3346536 RepID=UPI0036529C0F